MKNWLKNNWFKLIAIVMLVGALGSHPYSYYQLLRWVVIIAGIFSFYVIFRLKKIVWKWIYLIIIIFFNPLIPFYFTKNTWHFIDLLVIGALFVSLFIG